MARLIEGRLMAGAAEPLGEDALAHLEIRGLGKSFGATRALDDVWVAIAAGSVHAFVGENGAGKSTLGKIIAGVFPQDQGDLILRGEAVAFRSPREALDRGIALVAQEVSLVPRLTAAENVFLGAEPRRAGFIERRRLRAEFERVAREAGFDLDGSAHVGRLPLAKQQQVEILRALARDADLVVLDEPSASLSARELDRLHEVVRALAASSRTVVLVSHYLAEVLELADTVTILRDGKVVATSPTSQQTEASLISSMLGRSVGRAYPEKRLPPSDAPIALAVTDLRAPGVDGASLVVRRGEVVALAGLVGAGRSEFVRAIYGAAPLLSGTVVVNDLPAPGTPSGSIRAGVTMIPESRKDEGLMMRRPVRENVSIASLRGLSRWRFVRRTLERVRVGRVLDQVAGTRSLEIPATALSGGNQQKLLFARALLTAPGVLIADEPTRGVDVGAKRDLYEHLVGLAADGVAILLISNEIEEVLGLAHRVVVMRAGQVVTELSGDAMTEEAILAAAFGTAMAA